MDQFTFDEYSPELVNPIDISELVTKPIRFNFDLKSAENEDEAKLFDTNEVEPVMESTPWDSTFDELKSLMERLPKAKTQNGQMIYIYKRKMTDGAGEPIEKRRCRIQFIYRMFFEFDKTPFDTSFMYNSNVRTVLSDEIFTGIWIALKTMRKGEESQFIIDHRLMFGNLGVPLENGTQRKVDADVLLIAKLVDFTYVGSEEIDRPIENAHDFDAVKLRLIDSKDRAIDLFNNARFEQAIRVNHHGIECLISCKIVNDDQKKEFNDFMVEFHTNLMDCYVRTEKWQKVLSMIGKLGDLTSIDRNVRVLVNKAIATSKIQDDYNESIKILREAQKIAPSDPLVCSTLAKLTAEREKYKNDTKNLWQRAFQSKINDQTSNEGSATFKATFTELMKSFNDMELDSNVPLIGYTPKEMEKVSEVVNGNHNFVLKKGKDFNGADTYSLKKIR